MRSVRKIYKLKDRYKNIFICYRNICRSPMAEFVMKDMVRKRGQKA